MRIVNALKANNEEIPTSQPAPVVPELSDGEFQVARVPEDSDLQKMIRSTSAAAKRRAYKRFILEEASRRRTEMSDLLFVHVRRALLDRASFGGVTVAFKLPQRQNRAVFPLEIATCVCPARVQLDKKFGANFAALNFLNCRTINIPVRRIDGESDKDAAVRVLTEMFT